jgi:hypothetical protein
LRVALGRPGQPEIVNSTKAMIAFTEPIIASSAQRVRAAAVIGLAIAALVYLRLFNPVGAGLYPSCPLYSLTGLYCPGCGTTRGLHQLLHGNLEAALAMNPLMVLALPFVAYAFLSYALFGARGRSLPKVFIHPTLIKALFWVVVAYGVLRNIPVYPFTLLAPHTL